MTRSTDPIQDDYELVQRCVGGDVAAWEELYASHHDRLIASIKSFLPGRPCDMNLVDEIGARVWYALVEDDGELLTRYDPSRGARLITFMRVIAKDVLRRHCRSERRRRNREVIATRVRPRHHDAELDRNDTALDEFMDSLSAGDREFCRNRMLNVESDAGSSDRGASPASIWQRTRRLYKRFLRFMSPETEQPT